MNERMRCLEKIVFFTKVAYYYTHLVMSPLAWNAQLLLAQSRPIKPVAMFSIQTFACATHELYCAPFYHIKYLKDVLVGSIATTVLLTAL